MRNPFATMVKRLQACTLISLHARDAIRYAKGDLHHSGLF